jgi:hypothetical protein
MRHQIIKFLLIVFFVCVVLPASVLADPVTIQRLDFGRLLVKKNNSLQSITVNTDGSYSATSEIIVLDPPEVGIYEIDGLNPSSTISSVTVNVTDPLQCGCSSEQYFMDSFVVVAPPTNSSGVTTITIGARAQTSGNNNAYGSGLYEGELSLSFNY